MSSTMIGLSGIQRDLLRIVVADGPMTGSEIRSKWIEAANEDLLSGRLYSNLDTLVDERLVQKRQKNGRAYNYTATQQAKTMLKRQVELDQGALA